MNEKEKKNADMVGFKLELLNNKDEKIKVDLKRSNTWDTIFLLRKLSVISKWCEKIGDIYGKINAYRHDESSLRTINFEGGVMYDIEDDIDNIKEEIENLVDNINIQVNKMNIWFGFKEVDSLYFKCLEELYNIPSMKKREIHEHLHDNMDLMDRYKELLHEI